MSQSTSRTRHPTLMEVTAAKLIEMLLLPSPALALVTAMVLSWLSAARESMRERSMRNCSATNDSGWSNAMRCFLASAPLPPADRCRSADFLRQKKRPLFFRLATESGDGSHSTAGADAPLPAVLRFRSSSARLSASYIFATTTPGISSARSALAEETPPVPSPLDLPVSSGGHFRFALRPVLIHVQLEVSGRLPNQGRIQHGLLP